MAAKNYQNQQQQQNKEIKKPFIGPRPFTQDPEDQKLFFGRNYESEKIISLIYSHKLVLVYAQSGAGKTSLFNAQIVPELEKKGLQVLPIARVGIGSNLIYDKTTSHFPKSDNGRDSNSNEINLYLLNTFQSLVPNISHSSTLKNPTLSQFLKKYFPHEVNQRGKNIPQVLIFDQLEEIFNLFSNPNKWQEHQKDFFLNIFDALENDPLLRIVFVIREDYLAQFDPFVSTLPENLKPRFRLERLHKDEAIAAIKGPLEILNYDVPTDEIEQIVQDLMKIKVETITGKSLEVIGEFVEPIQLQVVCQRWWDERFISKNIQKDVKHLSDLTNVDKSLEDFYIKCIRSTVKQTNVKEEDLRKWCEENLITSSDTRSNIHLEANVTKGIPNKAIEILAELYLIRREWRAGAYWYELTHDRLIKPIKESNKEWISKKQKSKRVFRIKIFVPIILISIISISLYAIVLSTNIQDKLEQQRLEIKQQQESINSSRALIEQFTKGLDYYRQKRYNSALLEFDKVFSINPNYTEALFYNGLTLQELGKVDDAISYYDKVLGIDPTHVNALSNKASILYDQQKYDEAIQYYDKYLGVDPTDFETLSNKGRALDNLGRYEEAIIWYDKALAIDPNDVETLNSKGRALDNLGRYEEAIIWYDKALAIDPNDVETLNSKGRALDNLGRYEEAIIWYDKALAIDPNDVETLNSKGRALDNLGRYEEAIIWYDKALAIDPNDVETLNNKKDALQRYDEYTQFGITPTCSDTEIQPSKKEKDKSLITDEKRKEDFFIYDNTSLGFKIEYPKDWIGIQTNCLLEGGGMIQSSSIINFMSTQNSSKNGLLGITVADYSTGLSIDEFVKVYKEDFGNMIESTEIILLDERPAAKFIINTGNNTKLTQITILSNDKKYDITYPLSNSISNSTIQHMIQSFEIVSKDTLNSEVISEANELG